MAVKLHRCGVRWAKVFHACWRVEKALRDMGIEYEVVIGPLSRRKREAVTRLSGQDLYPVIELEDGSAYREESRAMAERIRAGKLFEQRSG